MEVTGTGMKMMMSCCQREMLTSASFVSQEIGFFYALVEEAFVLVGFFFEETAAFLDLVVF